MAEPADTVAEPDRRSVHITEPGAYARLRSGQLQVRRGDDQLLSVPISQVGRLVLHGPVTISAGLRTHALLRRIDVGFLTSTGRWLGRLSSWQGRNVRRRRAQYRQTERPEWCLPYAREIVRGKLANQRALLLRYVRRSGPSRYATQTATRLEELLREVDAVDTANGLLGIEGASAKLYFEGFATLVPEPFHFQGRNRRPPRDPINSLLSFGYALLLNEAVTAACLAGLDPDAGLLHRDVVKRPSLGLDLMEEFRPLLVDTLALSLTRRRQLSPEDFHQKGKKVLLTHAGRRVFLDAWEKRCLTRFGYLPTRRRITYRRAIQLQARQLAACIEETADAYQPVIWR